jgi:prepilin-type N-terminal cleavage/methylation domain-containing protein
MGQPALLNKKGVTLVEVLISLVISLVVFLALSQTAMVSIDSGVRNTLRDEAVGIAAGRMEVMRGLPYNSVVSDATTISSCVCPTGFPSTGTCQKKDLSNIAQFDFCTNLTCQGLGGSGNCAAMDTNMKQVAITVGWKWKGTDYTHRISTVRKQ